MGAREEKLLARWSVMDNEWALWQNDCCQTSIPCAGMAMFLTIHYYGGKMGQGYCFTQFYWVGKRHEARQRFVNHYGISRQADVWSVHDKVNSIKKAAGRMIAKVVKNVFGRL